ncbi:hypothetical protein D9611_011545 [Ephemerocybe angulata]|uniref:Piwi domain-containing protein n=1 Tax=Ephemerocybe angulata TaxID=980116 RepID=A0A8H5AWM8_9AGAR|nr:hypothetical protein D9611_011545 [Tulosesus angulatus]
MPPRAAQRGGRGTGRGGTPRGGASRGPQSAGRGGAGVGPAVIAPASHVKTIGVKRDGTLGFGQAGRVIQVQVNAFEASLPESTIHHYDVVTPDALPARVNLAIIKTLQADVAPHIFTPRGAYDGRKNLFCTTQLRLGPNGDEGVQEFDVPLAQTNGGTNPTQAPRVFKVKLTYVATINPELLRRFINGQQSHDDEATTAITACNVALRMEPNLNFPFNTRSFFIEQLERKNIGGGIELWRGLFQSLRPTYEKMFVNVDIATGMMYKRGPLLDLCLEIIRDAPGGPTGNINPLLLSSDHGLPAHIPLQIERFIKGVQVVVETTGNGKKRVVRSVTKVGAHKLTFDHNGTQMTVAQYFNQRLGRPLRYPTVLCVEVGRNALVPLEVCMVPPGQIMRKQIPAHKTKDVLAFSTKKPEERFRIIEQGIQYLNYGQSEYIRSFGMGIKTANGPMVVPGRVLNPPKLHYGNKLQVTPRDGSWNMAGKKLYKPCGVIKEWVIVVYENPRRFRQEQVDGLVHGLVAEANNLGMKFEHKEPVLAFENGNGNVGAQLKAAGQRVFQTKRVPPTLFVVVLPEGGDEIYTRVKHFGDFTQGVATQCLKSGKCSGARAQYWANVLLKINVKLGGINSIPDPSLASSLADPAKATVVMGADVIHPAPGAEGRPSFTALVSSVDLNCSKYVATDRVQEGRQEIIADMKEMVISGLQNYIGYRKAVERVANPKPQRLIFFRDGVSEGQFSQVIESELKMIKEALAEGDMADCKVTFVVVGKRHHLRFNAINPGDRDRSGNAPAGLVVDRIGHPVEFDFYLQSQGGLLGTSRSSHYSVLHDDNKFTADALQALSFSLCHVYARATRSVSIPAPVYYADIVCARAKTHYNPEHGGMLSDSASLSSGQAASNLATFQQHFARPSAYAQKNMYFS